MKKVITIIIAGSALALSPLVAGAQEFEEQHNNTGETFYNWCQDYPEGESNRLCEGYLSSVAFLLESGTSSIGPDARICVPDGVEFDDMVAVFMEYMDANPEFLQKRGGDAISAAWMSAYPCN